MIKVCEISSFIDTLMDNFTIHRKKPKASFVKFLQSQDIDRKTINDYVENKTGFIEEQIKELELAMSGADPQVKEGYGNFRKPELREFKEMLEQIIDDLHSYKDSKKIVRKRKTHSPEKLIKYISLNTNPIVVGTNSYSAIPTLSIIGAKHIFLYNAENRELSYYTGRSLSVRRTLITGFDSEKSWVRTIRKPEDFLTEIISCSKFNVENIGTLLTTKPKTPTGRTNSKQTLLKVLT
jgi:hypothetical protein